MNEQTATRLFDPRTIAADTVALRLIAGLVAALAIVPLVVVLLAVLGKINHKLRADIMARYRGWLLIVPALVVPIVLGAFWTIVGVGLLSLFCYREYARATSLVGEKWISASVVAGIAALTLAVLDDWYGLFMALPSLTVAAIVACAVWQDRPPGYIQRVALALFGYLLFGVCLGHLAYSANAARYRSLILFLLIVVELNDIFAFCCGKTFGRRKLCPNTSPNKTLGGSLGALVLTTLLVIGLGRFVFAGTGLDDAGRLAGLGLLLSIAGQFGDLTLSSIKRDLGIKDMAATIPGHGGLLDRFDSILLAAPVFFHYVHYYIGIGLGQPTHVFAGWLGIEHN